LHFVTHTMHAFRELVTQCGVALVPIKVKLKKILTRLRQYARGHAAAHDVLLNPQNVACMHKLSHLLRVIKTNGEYAGVCGLLLLQPFIVVQCCSLTQPSHSV
jgi:hypothetical protein